MHTLKSCFDNECDLTAKYPGSCACPNDCFRGLGRGWCDESSNTCLCNSFYGGPDCGTPICPYSCMGRGECITASALGLSGIGNALAADSGWCQCQDGWTTTDCGSIAFPGPASLPYGLIFPTERMYADDPYGDDHPLYNLTVIGLMKILIPNQSWLDLLLPSQVMNEPYYETNSSLYVNPTLTFQNGPIGMRLKGTSTKMYLKKSWKLKADKYHKNQSFCCGLTNFGLKEDPYAFINQLTVEFYRAFSIQTLRGSFLQLVLNDINLGYFWNEEDVDLHYLTSRFGNNSGNLYKGVMNAMLSPVGQGNPSDYENLMCGYDGQPFPCYEQSSGNGDWSDLANFIAFLNNSTDTDFEQSIEKIFDVEGYLRTTVIEAIQWDADGYSCGHGRNYYLYFNPGGLITMIRHDFDFQKFLVDGDIRAYGQPSALLYKRIFSIVKYQDRYLELMELLLKKVWNPFSPLFHRLDYFGSFMMTMTPASDPGFEMVQDYLETPTPFSVRFAQVYQTFLKDRYLNILQQISNSTAIWPNMI